jgi:hypothetical protein
MKISLTIALASMVGAISVQASRPSDESLNEMVKVMQVQKSIDLMVAQVSANMKAGMDQSMQQMLQGKEPTAEQKIATEKFQQKTNALFKEELSFSKMKDVYIQAYRDTFTQEEVDSIIAFYGSPAGKAMVEKIPVAMQKANTLLQSRMGPMMEKLQKLQTDFTAELSRGK